MTVMNSELKVIMKSLKDAIKMANIDIEVGERSTRPGREMARNNARNEIEKLQNVYKAEVAKNAFMLFPVGANADAFVDLAKKERLVTVVVDGSEFYQTLARRCQQTMGNTNVFGLTQFLVLNNEVKGWARENRVEFAGLNFSTDQVATTLNDITNIVRELIEKENGQRLVKTYIEGQVVTQALEQEVDSKVVPVVITNTTKNQQASLIGSLFRGKGLTIETDNQEINEEFLNKTFQSVKKALKG